MRELLEILGVMVLFATVILSLIFGVAIITNNYGCSVHQEVTGQETTYRAFGGCYIKYEGSFIDWKEYLAIKTASDLNK